MTEMPEKSNISAQADSKPGLGDIPGLLADGNTPFQAGRVELDEDGRIRLRNGGEPLRFVFTYRGADFEARLAAAPEVRLTLFAELGKVPYSMERGNSRRAVRRIVAATADLPSGRIEISASQDMFLQATAQPPHPLTPASVMAAITSLLLDFRPYLDLLREAILATDGRPERSSA